MRRLMTGTSMASLLSLPTELQDIILSYCDRQAIKTLRSLHRLWLDVASDALFSAHSTTYFPWSFERLNALSRSRLARRVKNLTIYSDSLGELPESCRRREDDEDYHTYGPEYVSFKEQLQFEVSGGSCSCMGTKGLVYYVPKAEWPEAYQAYLAFRCEQAKFFDSHGLEQLYEALRRLPQLESLSVTHFPEDDWSPLTRHLRKAVLWSAENKSITLAREMVTRIYSRTKSHTDALPKLLPAIATMRLRKLCVRQVYDLSWDLTQLQSVLDHLEELELDLTPGEPYGNEELTAMESATALLLKCPRLRSLTLRAGDYYAPFDAIFDRLLLSHTWPELQSLSVSAKISRQAWALFVERHDLKSLSMQRCSVDDVHGILRLLPGFKNLASVAVSELFQTRSLDDEPELYFPDGVDEVTKAWLCSGRGQPPLWKLCEERQLGECYGPDPFPDVILDVEYNGELIEDSEDEE